MLTVTKWAPCSCESSSRWVSHQQGTMVMWTSDIIRLPIIISFVLLTDLSCLNSSGVQVRSYLVNSWPSLHLAEDIHSMPGRGLLNMAVLCHGWWLYSSDNQPCDIFWIWHLGLHLKTMMFSPLMPRQADLNIREDAECCQSIRGSVNLILHLNAVSPNLSSLRQVKDAACIRIALAMFLGRLPKHVMVFHQLWLWWIHLRIFLYD